jgi:hypothetical protein
MGCLYSSKELKQLFLCRKLSIKTDFYSLGIQVEKKNIVGDPEKSTFLHLQSLASSLAFYQTPNKTLFGTFSSYHSFQFRKVLLW